MSTADGSRNEPFDVELSRRLDELASTVGADHPGEFDPRAVRIGTIDEARPPRRTGLFVAVAAVVVVAVGGLVALAGLGSDPAPADRPATPAADTTAATEPSTSAASEFRFETPTVRLTADVIEVITPVGTFAPSGDVIVYGDPGMPEQFTTLELTWFDGVEQRIHLYFASDGDTWWADEIRTYDGSAVGEWSEPIAIGRFFETPLEEAYTGDLDLPNLRIAGMTLEAFVDPDVCGDPDRPIALVADYPAITGSMPFGHGTTFQLYDTGSCEPVPVAGYTFSYVVDDPDIATITNISYPVPAPTQSSSDVTAALSPEQEFQEIKTRVEISFDQAGSTNLHATARDANGDIVDTVTVPITVTGLPEAVGAPNPTPIGTAVPVVDGDVGPSAPETGVADTSALLEDVPQPDGFDPAGIPADGITDRYALVVTVTGAVTCAWLDQWFTGQETGDQALSDQAAAALATATDWTALDEIETQGDWPIVVRQYADAVNGGEGVLTGSGPEPPSRDNARALGCGF